jgi:hypothetical protein
MNFNTFETAIKNLSPLPTEGVGARLTFTLDVKEPFANLIDILANTTHPEGFSSSGSAIFKTEHNGCTFEIKVGRNSGLGAVVINHCGEYECSRSIAEPDLKKVQAAIEKMTAEIRAKTMKADCILSMLEQLQRRAIKTADPVTLREVIAADWSGLDKKGRRSFLVFYNEKDKDRKESRYTSERSQSLWVECDLKTQKFRTIQRRKPSSWIIAETFMDRFSEIKEIKKIISDPAFKFLT